MKHVKAETSSRDDVVTATEPVFCLLHHFVAAKTIVNTLTTHLIMDAEEVELVANALRTLPLGQADTVSHRGVPS